MEVSSHALVLGRVDGIVFDVAGFTNLTQDHLDFHGDLEEYFAAKSALFTPERSRRAVVCVDGDHGRRLAAAARIPTSTLATDDRYPERSDWRVTGGAEPILERAGGMRVPFRTALPGAFNLANAALAVAMLAEAGVDLEAAVAGVGACRSVPGRMQAVTSDDPRQPLAIVDYAHTPDAIENVLGALGRSGRLIAVVGAGGDRDRDKRPLMGAAAASRADVVVVTDDNPRSEDPAAIRAAVIAGAEGVPEAQRAQILDVGERRKAIRSALAMAGGPGDTVVVLGKGHEQGQEIVGVVHPFDDRQVLLEELRRWSREKVAR
jgi:UDP-N-acetylmuramoyl-L-alanyl-D-glutamate--2,6-diaminopimelate ligase